MPKRSNGFQKLIHYIYTQITPEGATVTESSILKERRSGAEREVDILIEYEIAGTIIRLAVECRDRGRKGTIEWMDSLIGKYRDLDVDKVIAVSKLGFTPNAIAKASANKIDTRTLEEALNTDWSQEFLNLGVANISQQILIDSVDIDAEPPIEEPLSLSDSVSIEGGKIEGNLEELIKYCYEQKVLPEIREHLRIKISDYFKTLADFKKNMLAEKKINLSDITLTDKIGIQHIIKSLTFHTISVFTSEKIEVKNNFFEKAKITSAVIDSTLSDELHVTAIQVAGKKQGRIIISRKSKKMQ